MSARIRTRVVAKALRTRVKVLSPSRTAVRSAWARDLVAVRAGDLTFGELWTRHQMYVVKLARPWLRQCPSWVTPDDLYQEIWFVISRAIKRWKPERNVPIDAYVRVQIKYRLLRVNETHRKRADRELRFFECQQVEEKIIKLHGIEADNDNAPRFEAVAQNRSEVMCDAKRLGKLAVQSMPSARAQNLIAKVLVGVDLHDAAHAEYARCKRPVKAGNRAIAHALNVVESA